jgi:hypothetical protein
MRPVLISIYVNPMLDITDPAFGQDFEANRSIEPLDDLEIQVPVRAAACAAFGPW